MSEAQAPHEGDTGQAWHRHLTPSPVMGWQDIGKLTRTYFNILATSEMGFNMHSTQEGRWPSWPICLHNT